MICFFFVEVWHAYRYSLGAVSFSTKNSIWKRLLTYDSSYLQAFSSKGTMALSVFSIDYSGGTVGESHPIPFFQNQQLHASLRLGAWSMDIAKASGWRPLWTDICLVLVVCCVGKGYSSSISTVNSCIKFRFVN